MLCEMLHVFQRHFGRKQELSSWETRAERKDTIPGSSGGETWCPELTAAELRTF